MHTSALSTAANWQPETRVIAVSSGKGGVGKTNIATNLAVALARAGERTMLLDADLSLANIDVLLGIRPRLNLADVLAGRADIDDIVVEGPHGVGIVPATSGDRTMIDLDPASQGALVHAFGQLSAPPQNLIVDTAAGISDSVARFAQAAHQAIVVVCDEPSSITDSYALVKVFSRDYGISRFQIVTNMTRNSSDGRRLFAKFDEVAGRYLNVVLRHAGNIPADSFLKRAVQQCRSVVDAFPDSKSGLAFARLADALNYCGGYSGPNGSIEFFFERLLTAQPLRSGGLL